jgi:hypothetical protein
MSNGNTRDSQTIDSNTSNSNTNSLNCPTKIITAKTQTTRITFMKLITPITESRKNQPGITNHNINLMRVQAQNERTITQIQATVTKLLFVHTHTHSQQRTKQVSAGACVTWIRWAIRLWQDKRVSEHYLRPWCRGQPWRKRALGRRLCDHRERPIWVQSVPVKCALKLHTSQRPCYTHPTALGTHLVPHALWRIHLA